MTTMAVMRQNNAWKWRLSLIIRKITKVIHEYLLANMGGICRSLHSGRGDLRT